ncbi:hypothetical protein BDV38DRAFT_242688 [Aspergillus pseudotamarii]|uniref:Uncharacterized protein n=1 Tax=Aspergillus pseudotamarii TaxID=132259 RepID=A0A5N6SZT0_ASPPS|nr:uncharacterized protein BDV38DRAFT_242688 [Aspergillus pseudotamarii]KAE8139447.1 hypothetical protein BDV38DRAFT_242688 [Aspergillus pseudotamarii]
MQDRHCGRGFSTYYSFLLFSVFVRSLFALPNRVVTEQLCLVYDRTALFRAVLNMCCPHVSNATSDLPPKLE